MNDLVQVRSFLISHYNLDELRTLCFDLGIPYEELPGEVLSSQARELILYAGRHQKLEDLIDLLAQTRPEPFNLAGFRLEPTSIQKLYSQLPSIQNDLVPSQVINNAPPLPDNHVPRHEELDELRQLILNEQGKHRIALSAIRGMGGIGKSVLAAALCSDQAIQEAFPDGIIWVAIGRSPGKLVDKIQEVGKLLGDMPEYYNSLDAATNRLRLILPEKGVLIILDDVWDARHIEPFLVRKARSRILLTTRDGNIALRLGAEELILNVLKPDQAVNLLEEWAGYEESEFQTIAKRLGYLPLALEITGALLHKDMTAKEWLETFQNVSQRILGSSSYDPRSNLQVCFDLSVETLPENEQLLYYTLGIFPEDVWVPRSVVLKLWEQFDLNANNIDGSQLLIALSRLALIEVNSDRSVTLHDLLHDYTRIKLGSHLPSTHSKLLDAYNPDNLLWYDVKHDGYIYYHLVYHLNGAGREHELTNLLHLAPNWLETRQEPIRDLTVEGLIISLWENLWEKDSISAHEFLLTWLSRRSSRGESGDLSKLVAVKCAFYVSDDIALLYALRDANAKVRSSATIHAHFRYRYDPEAVLDQILTPLVRRSKAFGLPNYPVIRSVLELTAFLLLYEIPRRGPDTENARKLIDVGIDSARNALLMDNRITGTISRVIRRPMVHFVLRFLLRLLDNQNQSEAIIETAFNKQEVDIFFEQSQNEKEHVLKILPYFNRGYGDLADAIRDVVAVYDRTNYQKGSLLPLFFAGNIITIHGVQNPDGILPVIKAVLGYENPEWREERQVQFIGVWRTIMLRQSLLEKHWLDFIRDLTIAYYDNATQGYGIVIGSFGSYQYFPLAEYSQVWQRYFPNDPIDLVQKYLAKAEEEEDRNLIMHILKGFGDPRTRLANYGFVLGVLTKFLGNSDDEICATAVNTMARIRSLRQEEVDEYISRANIPQPELVEKVKELSYIESSYDIAAQFTWDFATAIFAYSHPQDINWLVELLDLSVRQNDLHHALEIFILGFFDKLERQVK